MNRVSIGSDNGLSDLVAYLTPSHYQNQCWVIVNWALRNKLQWNWNQNTKLFIHENAYEYIFSEMAAILPRWRWVKNAESRTNWVPFCNHTWKSIFFLQSNIFNEILMSLKEKLFLFDWLLLYVINLSIILSRTPGHTLPRDNPTKFMFISYHPSDISCQYVITPRVGYNMPHKYHTGRWLTTLVNSISIGQILSILNNDSPVKLKEGYEPYLYKNPSRNMHIYQAKSSRF